jgi:hypothetical protein
MVIPSPGNARQRTSFETAELNVFFFTWGLGEVLTTPSRENVPVTNSHNGIVLPYEMLPLEIKQSGGKLLPHSVLRGGGCFQREYLEAFKSGKGTFC